MIILYITSYGLKYYTLIFVQGVKSNLDSHEFWEKLEHLEATDIESQEYFYTIFYWLNDGRCLWRLLQTNVAKSHFSAL